MTGRNECGRRTFPLRIGLKLVLILLIAATGPREVRGDAPPDPVRLGMVQSLLKDVPKPLIKATMQPFRALMQGQTRSSSEVARPSNALTMAQQIANKEVELGVFQGIEFAWVREKHPELRPLVVAVNVHPNRQAHLIVRSDEPAAKIGDLKGKKLVIPRHSREHCQLFIDHSCRK